ncbi:MAG: hypothetical protein M3Q27_15580 [Actinomycetota bacterium]|nr:hypothetical protein [Actinomycetota bacterium]
MTNREWAKDATHRVGLEIKRLRGERKVQWLSDRTAELGHRVGRSRISDLERGDRGGVLDIAELVVLARALGVPPLQLLFPIGREAMTEVLPGAVVPTWPAAKWFTNEGAFPEALRDGGWGASTEDMNAWKAGVPLKFRKLDGLYKQWSAARGEVQRARFEASEATTPKAREDALSRLELAEERLRRAEDAVRNYREYIRQLELNPGDLSPEFAYIDEAPDGTGTDR